MNLGKFKIFIGLVLCFGINSCKDDCPCPDVSNPDCNDYDPCLGKSPADASFSMLLDLSMEESGEHFYQTDTIEYFSDATQRFVTFQVDDESVDSCWWTIGKDSRVFTEKKVTLHFGEAREHDIQVLLIVDKSSVQDCFSNKPVRDTVVRVLKFMPFGSSNIYGSYFGHLDDNNSDTMTLSITQEVHQGNLQIPIARGHLFGAKSFQFGYVRPGWSSFGIASYPLSRPLVEGIASLDGDDVTFEFIYEHSTEGKQNRTFKGKKQ